LVLLSRDRKEAVYHVLLLWPDIVIGASAIRKEGLGKVTGSARYVDDLSFPGLLHGVTVRSSIPRGIIRSIAFEGPIPWEEFTIVTAADIPGINVVTLILEDQPCLAAEYVNHPEEPIVLLAHPDKTLANEARKHVRIEYERLPPVFSLDESERGETVIWGKDNLFKKYLLEKGDVDRVWHEAAYIVEGEYRTGAQEQLYIENQGMIATADPHEGVTVRGSLQCPFYVHKALCSLFRLPPEKIRVIQTETGGAFGGKEEYPSMIAGHAALLAWKSGHPVKLMYGRSEDMAATTKRHPSRTRHRTAVDRHGKLLAMDIEFDLDGGGYATLSGVVLSRGTIHAAGPYECPNVRIRARAWATNTPPSGAFRGFGAPQSIFALERHMDVVAREIGLDPEEFRRRNFLSQGATTATGQVMREDLDLPGLMDRALEISDFKAKRERFGHQNNGSKKHGMGLSAFFHGAGFTGSGERYLQSVVAVEALANGRVRVLASSTEMGQGTNTILTQIAAENLGIDYDQVDIAMPDTQLVPNSGPTVASRTAMIVGKMVERASKGLLHLLCGSGLLKAGFRADDFRAACAAYIERHGSLRCDVEYQPPKDVFWDDETYRGEAYCAFGWAVYVAEVTVDLNTYEVQVDDFVAVQEVGRVINPVLAAGQIEGGVAQGIGFALYEKVAWREGRMVNNQMTNYIMPTSVDLPPIRVHFEEHPYEHGPGGAKGIGELPMDGPAPAIINAVENATGIRFRHVPLVAEDFLTAQVH
jgi:CO/xanthine dehydrogenase Mo-binding subunit